MTGVTAFSGMIPASPGRMQMKLQSRAMAPPVSMVTESLEPHMHTMASAICESFLNTSRRLLELGLGYL